MPDQRLALPPVLRSLLEQLPPELRGPVEAKIGVLEAELEKLGPGIAVLEAGLEAAAPFLAIEEAETQAALAAAAAANETAARAEEQTRVLSRALAEVRAAEAARWAEAAAFLTAEDDGEVVDLDRLARVLRVDDVAATEETFDAFMNDDDLPLVLGPRKSRARAPDALPHLDRTGRRLDGDGLVDLAPHISRLTVPGTLAQSAAGLWRSDEDSWAMLLGDGTRLQVVDDVLVRVSDETLDGAEAPSSLETRRLTGGAPPLLLPNAAAGLANAFACRERPIEASPDQVPALLGLGAATELCDPSEVGLSSVVPRIRALRGLRGGPSAVSESFLAVARDLYRVRTWLEPVSESPADRPAIHVGQVRWDTLAARPVYWMPVFAGDRTTVGGIDRPWTADPPAAAATWQVTAPAMRMDPEWVAPLVVVPDDPNVWAIGPDGAWWSLDADYDAIVLARREHREPWLRAVEELHRGLARESPAPQQLGASGPSGGDLSTPMPETKRLLDAGGSQGQDRDSGTGETA